MNIDGLIQRPGDWFGLDVEIRHLLCAVPITTT